MIISYDESTFGKKKQIVSKTVVFVKCDNCLEMEWKTLWMFRKLRELDICQSCRNILGISGMKNKKHSQENIEKFRIRMIGESNPAKREEVRKKISQKLKGREVPWIKGKKRSDQSKFMKERMRDVWDNNNEEYREYRERLKDVCKKNVILMRKKSLYNGGISNLQREIKSEMIKEGITGFEGECCLGDYIVDELNDEKSLIIEIFGDYWHANPQRYDGEEKIKFPKGELIAKDIWSFDRKRISFIETLGYKILVIWEKEWKDNKKEIIKRIKEFTNV